MVLATAFRIVSDADVAEDVLQEVFLGLHSALARYVERERFAAWLGRVTVRVALMHLRRERSRRQVSLEGSMLPSVRPDTRGPTRDAIATAIRALPEPLRLVFVLREVEGYTHREIAALLGIRENASHVRHHRAVRALRAALGDSNA